MAILGGTWDRENLAEEQLWPFETVWSTLKMTGGSKAPICFCQTPKNIKLWNNDAFDLSSEVQVPIRNTRMHAFIDLGTTGLAPSKQ